MNHDSGVVGSSTSANPGYGNGVIGKGGYVGVMGLGITGAYAVIYATAESATYGFYVDGATNLNGNISGTEFIHLQSKTQKGYPAALRGLGYYQAIKARLLFVPRG